MRVPSTTMVDIGADAGVPDTAVCGVGGMPTLCESAGFAGGRPIAAAARICIMKLTDMKWSLTDCSAGLFELQRTIPYRLEFARQPQDRLPGLIAWLGE